MALSSCSSCLVTMEFVTGKSHTNHWTTVLLDHNIVDFLLRFCLCFVEGAFWRCSLMGICGKHEPLCSLEALSLLQQVSGFPLKGCLFCWFFYDKAVEYYKIIVFPQRPVRCTLLPIKNWHFALLSIGSIQKKTTSLHLSSAQYKLSFGCFSVYWYCYLTSVLLLRIETDQIPTGCI